MGKAAALRFAQEGARVAVSGRRASPKAPSTSAPVRPRRTAGEVVPAPGLGDDLCDDNPVDTEMEGRLQCNRP